MNPINLFYLLFVVVVTTAASFVRAAETHDDSFTPYLIGTYHAIIEPLMPDTYDVSGYVVLFTKQESELVATERQSLPTNPYVGYAGKVYNIESNLTAASCTQVNGCGVHVHSGTSCTNATTQGGHYYNNATVDEDPWIEARYFTDADLDETGISTSNFWGILDIGTADINGRVFVVHSENGTRIGCGVIEKVEENLLSTVTSELAESSVAGQVVVYASTNHGNSEDEGGNVVTCYFGVAESLEPDLVSYLNPDPFVPGMDCNFTNGCGVHIHNGTSCADKTTQGGHFDGPNIVDPWLFTMYHTTDSVGDSYFTGCVETGISDISSFTDRPFVIHSNNGSRVSCGMLQAASSGGNSPPSPPSASPPTAPTSTTSDANTAATNMILTSIIIATCLMGLWVF